MDLRKLKTLIDLVSDSNVSELEITEAEGKVRIVKGAPAVLQGYALAPPPAAAALAPAAAAIAAPAEVAAPEAAALHAVKSPMVGTVYRRPSPEAKAFVDVGSQVKAGEKILLVEAMKTFNEIVAPRAGTVTAIMVEDGQPIEYGQPLLVIE
jgi:acetyl-CoA carboxylase biotin carboxyl carrier protein